MRRVIGCHSDGPRESAGQRFAPGAVSKPRGGTLDISNGLRRKGAG